LFRDGVAKVRTPCGLAVGRLKVVYNRVANDQPGEFLAVVEVDNTGFVPPSSVGIGRG
jgi:hypothetical protein